MNKKENTFRLCEEVFFSNYWPFLVHKKTKTMVSVHEHVNMKANCSKGESPCSLCKYSVIAL